MNNYRYKCYVFVKKVSVQGAILINLLNSAKKFRRSEGNAIACGYLVICSVLANYTDWQFERYEWRSPRRIVNAPRDVGSVFK